MSAKFLRLPDSLAETAAQAITVRPKRQMKACHRHGFLLGNQTAIVESGDLIHRQMQARFTLSAAHGNSATD